LWRLTRMVVQGAPERQIGVYSLPDHEPGNERVAG